MRRTALIVLAAVGVMIVSTAPAVAATPRDTTHLVARAAGLVAWTCPDNPSVGDTCDAYDVFGMAGVQRNLGDRTKDNVVDVNVFHLVWAGPVDGWVQAGPPEAAETHGGLRVAGTLGSAVLDLGSDVPLCSWDETGACVPDGNVITLRARLTALARPTLSWEHRWSKGTMFGHSVLQDIERMTPADGSVTVDGTMAPTLPGSSAIYRIVNHANEPVWDTPPAAMVTHLVMSSLAATTHETGWLRGEWAKAGDDTRGFWVSRQESNVPEANMVAACYSSAPDVEPTCVFPPIDDGSVTLTVAPDIASVGASASFGDFTVSMDSVAAGPLDTQTGFTRDRWTDGSGTHLELYRSVDESRGQTASLTVGGTTYAGIGQAGTSTADWVVRTRP